MKFVRIFIMVTKTRRLLQGQGKNKVEEIIKNPLAGRKEGRGRRII